MYLNLLFKGNNIPLYVYITFCLSIHLSKDLCVTSFFWLLWIMLPWMWVYKFKTLISINLYIYRERDRERYTHTPRSGTVVSYNSIFNLFRNCHTVSYSGCTILNSHLQGTRAPISSQSCQYLLLLFYFYFIN